MKQVDKIAATSTVPPLPLAGEGWGGDQTSHFLQMLTSHPLLRRFENRLEIGKHVLEWTIRGRDVFFRPQEADVEIIWCCLGKYKYAQRLRQLGQIENLLSNLALRIEHPNDLVWRYWALAEDCELFFCEHLGMARFEKFAELASFRTGFRTGWDNFTPNQLFCSTDKLQEMVENCREEVARAQKMMSNVETERCWSSVQWSCGTHQELKALIQAMGILIRQPEHECFQWRYEIQPDFSGRILVDHPYPRSARCPHSLYRKLLDCLRAHSQVKSGALNLAPRDGLERGVTPHLPIVIISPRMPSQHEKLEALLTWREFLRDKIPADEIDELLRPFQ